MRKITSINWAYYVLILVGAIVVITGAYFFVNRTLPNTFVRPTKVYGAPTLAAQGYVTAWKAHDWVGMCQTLDPIAFSTLISTLGGDPSKYTFGSCPGTLGSIYGKMRISHYEILQRVASNLVAIVKINTVQQYPNGKTSQNINMILVNDHNRWKIGYLTVE